MSERLVDLDELVLRCRDKLTKAYIQEAVTCYRAGAFRSCIVATWNAVVFDFIHKLRQLEQTGHRNATDKLEKLEKIRSRSDVSQLLSFEKTVLDVAQNEFEFISPIEYSDLKRLLEDRNRCAHPSLQSIEETFEASAELARYHLRNAVMHLLQHPPVQGRAALETIQRDIDSELFPSDVEQAVNSLKSGPLGRARKPLIRSVIVTLTKSLLLADRPKVERARQFAALQAVFQIYFEIAEELIKGDLPGIISGVGSQSWSKVVSYLRYIKAWEYLNGDIQNRTNNFIQQLGDTAAVPVLLDALDIPELRSIAVERAKHLPPEILTSSFKDVLSPEDILPIAGNYVQDVVKTFTMSPYGEVKTNGKALLQVTPLLTREQLEVVLDACCKKDQIYSALGIPEILQELFQKTTHLHEATIFSWAAVRSMLNKPDFDEITSINALKELMDLKLPNLLTTVHSEEKGDES